MEQTTECYNLFIGIELSIRLFCLILSQGYIALELEKSFKKFYGKYQDLEKCQRSVKEIVNDSFLG